VRRVGLMSMLGENPNHDMPFRLIVLSLSYKPKISGEVPLFVTSHSIYQLTPSSSLAMTIS
jgi:hypothetical protein